MKLYIFVTTSIQIAGGNQCYMAAKAKYLESTGWRVVVFSPNTDRSKQHCLIDYLDKYLEGNIIELVMPPFKYPKAIIPKVVKKMENVIGDTSVYDEIIMESHEDSLSQWGELLARKITARHYFFMMNEFYRGEKSYYEKKIGFYEFKLNRQEIEGSLVTLERLFDGYRKISHNDLHGVLKLDECPIQDYKCDVVDAIQKQDWNIWYIGRGNKTYVPNIIKDVGRFAGLYPEKSIQFLTVGDMDLHRKLIEDVLAENKNLSVTELGFLHPLPSRLFKKTDAVIAGSGSARHSCEEGAIVIVADTETKMSDGILGYETLNSVYQSEDSVCTDFVDALKRVLIDKVYLQMPYRFPPKLGVEEQTKQHFELFAMSERNLAYYDEKELIKGKTDWVAVSKLYLFYYMPTFSRIVSHIIHPTR